MSLSLVAPNNVVQLRLDSNFRRPHGVGLLPGRVIAGLPARAEAEALLGLAQGALREGRADRDWPRGYWQWEARTACAAWQGARTDAPAPLKGPPPTSVRLGSVLARLAEDGIVLAHGRLLSAGGWTERMDAADITYHLLRGRVSCYAGLAAVFTTVTPGVDGWQCEIYANGMVWADTPGRLDFLCACASACAVLR